MRKLVRTENGFSLIELMVVVGIIGILAAIAVPQFSKFQAKARQTEAKTGLAALYTSEKGFFTEYTAYTTDIKNAGFGLEGNRLRYEVGFDGAAGCAAYPGGAPTEHFGGSHNKGSLVSSIQFAFATVPTTTAVTSCDCGTATFVAAAWGNPNSTASAANNDDIWTMDQAKSLTNSVNGIK